MTPHALHSFFDSPGHGPDWLWILMALFAFMAIQAFIAQHGGERR